MSPNEREETIIDFIRSNPYCNVQDLVQGVENHVSRVTVFKILHKLSENGVVKKYSENNQKINAREHILFVDESNPLVSVRLELEQFQSAYYHLLGKAFDEFKLKLAQYHERKDRRIRDQLIPQMANLASYLLHIFYTMVDVYLFRFLFNWSQKISDQKMLQQLYSMIFSKIAEMQIQLSGEFKSISGLSINLFFDPLLQFRIRSGGDAELTDYLDFYNKLGMEKEIESVMDSLWKIIGDLQSVVYPEPREHGWSFKYGEDDWRKLVSLMRKHPRSTIFERYEDFRKWSSIRRGRRHRKRI